MPLISVGGIWVQMRPKLGGRAGFFRNAVFTIGRARDRSCLFWLAGGNGLLALDGAQSFAYRRASRDESHALTEAFAFSWCLAGVPVGGVDRGAVAAQTEFSRRLRYVPPALGITRGPLFVLRFGFVHGTPPVTGIRRNPVFNERSCLPHPLLRLPEIIPFYRAAFQ